MIYVKETDNSNQQLSLVIFNLLAFDVCRKLCCKVRVCFSMNLML